MASAGALQSNRCSGSHNPRLYVGEGDFTYTEAVVTKHQDRHPNLGKSITATELRMKIDCQDCLFPRPLPGHEGKKCEKCTVTAGRIDWLKSQGVTFLFGVDATKLHETPGLKGRSFSRIHWNIPHDGSKRPSETMPRIIGAFFASCSNMQEPGGRVYLSIKQPPGTRKNAWFQVGVHEMLRGASTSSYVLDTKRRFDKSRYPKYQHLETARNASNEGVEHAREFVFKKITLEDRLAIHRGEGTIKEPVFLERASILSKKGYSVGIESVNYKARSYYLCDTDPESSDYSDHEADSLVEEMERLTTKEEGAVPQGDIDAFLRRKFSEMQSRRTGKEEGDV